MSLQQDNVLVVDDESSLRKTLRTSLTASGFAVEEAGSGEEALGMLRHHSYDLVLLDINMPGMDGINTCRQIRDVSPRAGIVMITVRDLDDDKVQALEAGADDYVTKPFKLRELIARLRAVLLRTRIQNPGERMALSIGCLKIDFLQRLLWRDAEQVHLSPIEFDLLSFLMKNAGAPLTHLKLLRSVWGPEYGNELEYLRTYIRMLRKKIEPDPAKPVYLVTEPWVGYRFCNPGEPD